MTKNKSNKLFLIPKMFPKKNPNSWVKLLTSISMTGHTSGPTSENYIQGYQAVFEEWGIIKGRSLDLKLIDRVLKEYKETGIFPAFKP
ncbi:MAG: hypothetical protein COX63_02050 [Candidatus Diapherotrites archaeon CG_4_10_14_0_2_um_filter_31_5]|nr:MAG: hypothetical protein COX63_02050 [Candidatus Diapherotrites archaeon CG_4_10_14_0_2_um_filter_31_5]